MAIAVTGPTPGNVIRRAVSSLARPFGVNRYQAIVLARVVLFL